MARQGLDPKILIAIISIVVLVLAVVFWEVWHGSAAGSPGCRASRKDRLAALSMARRADMVLIRAMSAGSRGRGSV